MADLIGATNVSNVSNFSDRQTKGVNLYPPTWSCNPLLRLKSLEENEERIFKVSRSRELRAV